MILAATGHRKFISFNYNQLYELAKRYIAYEQPSKVISGMALGWDMAVAQVALDLGIPLTAAIPFEGQDSRWPDEPRRLYQILLGKASEKQIICEGPYAAWKFQKRNEWMVDNCQMLLAAWNGQLRGGTYNCLKYATSKHTNIKYVSEILLSARER